MVDKGDDEKFKGFKTSQKSFSKCVFWVDLYERVLGLHFMKEYLDYREFQRTIIIHWCYKVDHVKEGCGSL